MFPFGGRQRGGTDGTSSLKYFLTNVVLSGMLKRTQLVA